MSKLLLLLAMMIVTLCYDAEAVDTNTMDKFNLIVSISGCNLIITSGDRSKAHNKAVGGSKSSYHMQSKAIDFKPHKSCSKSLDELFDIAVDVGFNGVIKYKYHIHVDTGDRIYHRR